ncbi:MAG: HNH endonuclease [Myxococcales bacterium]
MIGASLHFANGHLEALAATASILPWPLPRERDESVCHETMRAVEALLIRVGRGIGALDVAIGDGLATLGRGDHVLRLGFSSIGDYARERLGKAASTAQKMERLARELRSRPLLRLAVRAGEVSVSAAEAVLPVAQGEEEACWVARARSQTVRALRDAVKAPDATQAEEDERWMRFRAHIPEEGRRVVDDAIDVAGKMLGPTSLKGQRLEKIAEEFYGGHPLANDDAAVDHVFSARAGDSNGPLEDWLEKESANWAFLDQIGPVAAPGPDFEEEADPWRVDEELRRLAALRDRWDEVLGHLAMLFCAMDGWRRAGFASFEHYCRERLGMSARAVRQRAALERKLYELPALRQAMQERRISYEKARLIARYADDESVGAWIERAERMTCIALRRQLQGKEEMQMSARGELDVWLPRRVGGLLALAFAAARKEAGRWLSPGECLVMMAAHFIEVWKPVLAQRSTLQRRILARDRWLCQVPGCSRAAAHAHHIEYRSHGGSDDPSNLVSLCAAHHLHGVHIGAIRVSGKAPDRLRWEVRVACGWEPFFESGGGRTMS